MTLIVPAPFEIAEIVSGHPRSVARYLTTPIRRIVANGPVEYEKPITAIDIKTVQGIFAGKGRISKAKQLARDIITRLMGKWPLQSDRLVQIFQSSEDWEVFAAAAEAPDHKEAGASQERRVLSRYLLPLNATSKSAASALEADDLELAKSHLMQSPILRTAPAGFLDRIAEAKDRDEFIAACTSLRMFGILILIALSERYLNPKEEESALSNCLPLDEAGSVSNSPFSICVRKLAQSLDLHEVGEISKTLLGDDSEANRKKWIRWTNSTSMPSRSEFEAFIRKFAELKAAKRRLNAPYDRVAVTKFGINFFYQLRLLTWLSLQPELTKLSERSELFKLYPTIFAMLK